MVKDWISPLLLVVVTASVAVAAPPEASFDGQKSADWAKLLRDGDDVARQGVVERLRAGKWDAVAVLKEILGQRDEVVRKALLVPLVAWTPEEAKPLAAGLKRCLSSKSQEIRGVAACVLARCGEEVPRKKLQLILKSDERAAVRWGLRACEESAAAAESVSAEVLRLFVEGDDGLAMDAAPAVGLLAKSTDGELAAKATAAIEAEENPLIQALANAAAGRDRETTSKIFAVTILRNPAVPRVVTRRLVRMGDDASPGIEFVWRDLPDEPTIREMVARLSDARKLEIFERGLDSPQDVTQLEAILGLGRLGKTAERLVPKLKEIAKSGRHRQLAEEAEAALLSIEIDRAPASTMLSKLPLGAAKTRVVAERLHALGKEALFALGGAVGTKAEEGAMKAITMFGPDAVALVPDVVRALGGSSSPEPAMAALDAMGPGAIEPMLTQFAAAPGRARHFMSQVMRRWAGSSRAQARAALEKIVGAGGPASEDAKKLIAAYDRVEGLSLRDLVYEFATERHSRVELKREVLNRFLLKSDEYDALMADPELGATAVDVALEVSGEIGVQLLVWKLGRGPTTRRRAIARGLGRVGDRSALYLLDRLATANDDVGEDIVIAILSMEPEVRAGMAALIEDEAKAATGAYRTMLESIVRAIRR